MNSKNSTIYQYSQILRAHKRSFYSLWLLVVLPILLCFLIEELNGNWMFYGGVIWAGAVIAKIAAGVPVYNVLSKFFDPKSKAYNFFWGVWSTSCELGLSLAFFHYYKETLGIFEVISFGLGAGVLESLLVIFQIAAPVLIKQKENKPSNEQEERSLTFLQENGFRYVFLERFGASLGHLGSRVLLVGALGIGPWFAPWVAWFTFSIVDGSSSYLSANDYDFFDSVKLGRFLIVCLIISLMEVSLAGIFYAEILKSAVAG